MTADHIPHTFQVDLRGLLGRSSAAGIRARTVLDEYGNEGDTAPDNIPARRRAEARALHDYLE
ncbi:hypothetical protein [Streptomyces tubercidicus]|uniref:hypothetical protein n=1 Tax=Streptomyces tubercidicus TaxID=47759 RepID=UPI0036CFDD19